MTNPYLNYKKDGLNRLLQLARALCVLVTSFAKIIRVKYAGNAAIIALVDSIEGLCALLPAAEEEFAAIPLQDVPLPTEPGVIPGENPSAPPTADPDEMA